MKLNDDQIEVWVKFVADIGKLLPVGLFVFYLTHPRETQWGVALGVIVVAVGLQVLATWIAGRKGRNT